MSSPPKDAGRLHHNFALCQHHHQTTAPARPTKVQEHEQEIKKGEEQEKESERQQNEHNPSIRPTKKRFFILFMYMLLQMIKSFQWICLASITNVVAKFYQVDNMAINWTTIMFMFTFMLFGLPVSWLTDSFGLRRSVLIGSLGVTCGLIIKVFSCHRAGFWLGLLGHLIVGLSEPFFFSSYSQVASIWFPDNQVASATSFALVGEQLGLALGFIVPPLLVGPEPDNVEAIERGLYRLFLFNAVISSLNTLSIWCFFDDEPEFAPGVARLKQIVERRASRGQRHTHLDELRQQVSQLTCVLSDRNFLLLLVGFGINVGSAYSIHTLLNQMIIKSPQPQPPPSSSQVYRSTGFNSTAPPALDHESEVERSQTSSELWQGEQLNLVVANSGLILIVAGLFGSVVCGSLLDRFHSYKLTTASIYLMSLISMILLTLCLGLESPLLIYLVSIPLGFAYLGYASSSFDYGVEITYPRPELLSATLLNLSAQLFGIPISLVGSRVVDTHGGQALGLFFSLVLLAGFLLTCLQGGDLRRQTAVNAGDPLGQGAPVASKRQEAALPSV